MRFDPDLFNSVSKTLIEGISVGYKSANLKIPTIRYLGMGPVPAEYCCPDLVVWVTNVRPWDSASPDTLVENRILIHWGLAFDLNVRIGECYLEMTDKGGTKESADITEQTKVLNKYGIVTYESAINSLMATGACGASDCNMSVTPLPMSPYNEGGCAGWNMVFTVAIL